MLPHPAVMLTSPAKAPFKVCAKWGFPYHIQVVIKAAIPPAAAARFVINTTLEAPTASTPPHANCDPPLNPNHPSHRMKTPNVASTWLWPGMGITFPSTNFPILGPTKTAATRAAHPPTECTMEDPAKSINPASANQPPTLTPSVTPFHCHPPDIG